MDAGARRRQSAARLDSRPHPVAVRPPARFQPAWRLRLQASLHLHSATISQWACRDRTAACGCGWPTWSNCSTGYRRGRRWRSARRNPPSSAFARWPQSPGDVAGRLRSASTSHCRIIRKPRRQGPFATLDRRNTGDGDQRRRGNRLAVAPPTPCRSVRHGRTAHGLSLAAMTTPQTGGRGRRVPWLAVACRAASWMPNGRAARGAR